MVSRFGSLLVRCLDERGLSQVVFAARVGVTQGYVSQVIHGRSRPDPDALPAWAAALELDEGNAKAFVEEGCWTQVPPPLWKWRSETEQRIATLEAALAKARTRKGIASPLA